MATPIVACGLHRALRTACVLLMIRLQFLEEVEQAVTRPISSWWGFNRTGFGKDFLFSGEVSVQVDLRSSPVFVSQPDRNERAIHAGFEQFHCCRVALDSYDKPAIRNAPATPALKEFVQELAARADRLRPAA